MTVESMSFRVGSAYLPVPPVTAENFRSHPAYVGRVGSRAEFERRMLWLWQVYGEAVADERCMTRGAMAATRRMRSQERRTARRALRRGGPGVLGRRDWGDWVRPVDAKDTYSVDFYTSYDDDMDEAGL